jgi:16S rRNA (uracil1498-N3)-methyltransferase
MYLSTALEDYADKLEIYICEQGSTQEPEFLPDHKFGVFIGPEGGWSDSEKEQFAAKKIRHLGLGDFTLRAETAAIIASSKLLH